MSKKDKEYIKVLEQEKSLLKLTLEHYVKENSQLKQTIDDMKVTVRANKDQLNEYISTITNKDMAVEKMNNTINQLKSRLENLEKLKKQGGAAAVSNVNTIPDKERINIKTDDNVNEVSVETQNNKEKEDKRVNKECLNCNKVKTLKSAYEKIINYKTKIIQQFDGIRNDIDILKGKFSSLKEQESKKENFEAKVDSSGIKINFINNLTNKEDFCDFISKVNSKDILLLIDDRGVIWELVQRKDLNVSLIKSNLKIYSLKELLELNTESNEVDPLSEYKPNILEADKDNDELNISKNSNMNKILDQFNDNKSESVDD